MVTKRGAAIAGGITLAAAVVTVAGFFIGDVPSLIRSLSPPASPSSSPQKDSVQPTGSDVPSDAPADVASPTPIPQTTDDVNTPATLAYLVDLEPVDEYNDGAWDWDEGTVSVNGSSYPRSLYDVDVYERSSLTFDLSRDYETFTATAGVLDSSTTGSAVRIEVFVDETRVLTQDVGLGESVPIRVDVTDALRLRLDITNIDPEAARRPDAGFGEALVS